ncbi:MAG TPA: helix-turn-helix domain-containing protein [Negativicutes bacterium]
MVTYKNTQYLYSIELTLDLIGGKWKSLILWYLGENTLRFSELRRALPQVTQKMLTHQLRDLEENRLINRFIHTQIPPKVEYSLTETGKSLLPILATLNDWGIYFANQAESTGAKRLLETCQVAAPIKKS